ncbi:Limulus clotting factor C [Eumeta japonica]|uniref:Limulus clotting factor C n=1 Tax=Eumeta variegata TaxID=151549 RepID=A0A4C1VR83_EUMVA|nr:Limulus clotting factor C [Eumeta japonica]
MEIFEGPPAAHRRGRKLITGGGRSPPRECSSGRTLLTTIVTDARNISENRECPELEQPEIGTVTVTGRLFGDRATYSCPQGYHVVGLQSRSCQADGQWAGQVPSCKENNTRDPSLQNEPLLQHENSVYVRDTFSEQEKRLLNFLTETADSRFHVDPYRVRESQRPRGANLRNSSREPVLIQANEVVLYSLQLNS